MRRRLLAVALLLLVKDSSAAPKQPFYLGLEPPWIAATAPKVPRKPGEAIRAGAGPVVRRLGAQGSSGTLTGKTVYLSPGHGFVWTGSAWRTQRGNSNDLVEDLANAEAVDEYLVEYLRLMGAYVVTVREWDRNPESVVVDDADATVEGQVTEAGTDTGWGAVSLPITSDDVHPFQAGTARKLTAAASETGRVVYAPTIPRSGLYGVHLSYVQGDDRASDAHYVVRHAGGETHFRVDQRRHGGTWVMLGRFWFEAGAPEGRASVAVVNDSATAAAIVSLDAVRFGGGMGVISRNGAVSGRPMYENCARSYAQLAGAPTSVFQYASSEGSDDVGTRSRFVDWDHEDGEDAVYLSWHSNAFNGSAVGFESYTYGPSAPPGPLAEFSGVPGSRELQAAVHAELVADVRADWDATFVDRGQHTAYFGEINPSHNDEVPGMLIEVAFHDAPTDAAMLKDPRFRRLVARAVAQGIAKYFAAKDGRQLVLPPEPPTALRVENDGVGGLGVSWREPDADAAGGDLPTSYRVYTSLDGRAFDDGVEVTSLATTLAGLAVGEARYVRVTAVNAGGESLPSEVVGARVAAAGHASVLVVGGFDRLDRSLMVPEDMSAYGLGTPARMYLDRMNDGTYAARHGAAVAGAGFSFDGATDEAVGQGDVDLTRYQAVDWFVGEESAGEDPDRPFLTGERAAVTAYLAAGGRIFVSGSEIGWALDAHGTIEEQAFYHDALRATYDLDDAETYAVIAPPGPYEGLPGFTFDDTGPGSYDAEWPDTLLPGMGAAAVLEYQGGVGGVAAIAWGPDEPGQRGIVAGFPFETVAGEATRREVMQRTLAFFSVEEPVPPDAAPRDAAPPDAGAPDDVDHDAGAPGLDDVSGGCGCHAGAAPRSGRPWLTALLLWPALAWCRSRRRHARR